MGDSTMNAAFLNEGLSDSVHSWEVQLVLEYCDKGSLRALLNKQGMMTTPGEASCVRMNRLCYGGLLLACGLQQQVESLVDCAPRFKMRCRWLGFGEGRRH